MTASTLRKKLIEVSIPLEAIKFTPGYVLDMIDETDPLVLLTTMEISVLAMVTVPLPLSVTVTAAFKRGAANSSTSHTKIPNPAILCRRRNIL